MGNHFAQRMQRRAEREFTGKHLLLKFTETDLQRRGEQIVCAGVGGQCQRDGLIQVVHHIDARLPGQQIPDAGVKSCHFIGRVAFLPGL